MRDRRKRESDVAATAAARTRVHDGTNRSQKQILPNRDVIGVIAEKAFEAMSGLKMSLEITGSGDEGFDFVTPGGLTIDIKATPRLDGRLMVRVDHTTADIYVLAHVMEAVEEAHFMGWCYKNDLIRANKIETYHSQQFYVMHKNMLRPMVLGGWS